MARLWRGWPISGAALMLLIVMLLGNAAAAPDTVLAVAVAAYVAIGAVLFVLAGPLRVHVRSMSIILIPGTADEDERRKYREWQALVQILTTADRMATTGAISSAEHKATWQHAYHRLGAITHD
jgi:Family of unknown function (DUF6611)